MENLREIIYQNYRIVYRVKSENVEIVTIVHCARLLDHL
ncbi:MAG: type II toxin-antitoxin system RelE/ParE family toxin [Candidatus Lokiarchaeota archaeon]|nr:type II toxin-antitoxin system RelE/ParE family toxin [Candidatus Lokiarchaeota archaeon]